MNSEDPQPTQPKRLKFDFAKEARERDRVRKQSPEFIALQEQMIKVFESKSPRGPAARKAAEILNSLKSLMGIDWWRQTEDSDDACNSIGIKWWTGLGTPPIYLYRPDQDYWSYFVVGATIFQRTLCIEFRIKKQPYKNTEEYLTWRRAKKSNTSYSSASL